MVGGATDGALFVWDTRSDKLPLTHIKKHSASVLEVILSVLTELYKIASIVKISLTPANRRLLWLRWKNVCLWR